MKKPFTLITAALLAVGGAVHIVRVIVRADITVGTMVVPQAVSVVGIVVAFVLCWGLLRERRE